MVQNRQSRQLVPVSCFKVVEVMRRSDLDGPRAELAVDEDRISDDWDCRGL